MAEVGVAELRRDLKTWLARVRAGDEVTVTDRGLPVARLTSVEAPAALERLVAEGRISRPTGPRPQARGLERVRGTGPASTYVTEARDSRRT